MNARYHLSLSWFAVLVAVQALVMGTFQSALPVSAAGTNFCSLDLQQSDSGYAVKELLLANQYGNTALGAVQSSFSPDAGFMTLYSPTAAQPVTVCVIQHYSGH